MKKIFFLIVLCSSFAQAQVLVKIDKYAIQRTPFVTDTATAFSFKVVEMTINLTTAEQKPIFQLVFVDSSLMPISAMQITMQDLQNACKKNNFPEEQHQEIIQSAISTVFTGTKSEKLAAFSMMLQGYGIIVKPEEEQ